MTWYDPLMRARANVIGETHGLWTVIADAPDTPERNRQVVCRCVCGEERTLQWQNVRRGLSKSCGCAKVELISNANATHRLSHTPMWICWQAMKRRCLNTTSKSYPNYGGRGITVCERWLHDVAAFAADMGPRPYGYTIERIDNDGNYEPANCRWATRAEQLRNTRRNNYVTVNGTRMTIAEAAREVGVGRTTIEARLRKGWTEQAALGLSVE